jgi:hypothetical protein
MKNLYMSLVFKTIFIAVFSLFFAGKSLADYTINAGQNIDASTLTVQSGVLTINGTLTVTGNQSVSLLGFTSVIITCPGQIFWTGNGNLTFAGGTSIEVNPASGCSSAYGLQPEGGSASAALVVGSIRIAVSNNNSNNAAYSFKEFNNAGGLAAFTITGSSSPMCYGSPFSVTVSPTDNVVPFNCTWTVNQGSISPGTVTAFTSPITATITPTNSSTAQTYTITATIARTADKQQDPLAVKTFQVTVNPTPSVASTTTSTCTGTGFSITPANGSGNVVPSGTSYSWSAPTVTGGLTGGAAGTNASSITGTLINSTNTSQTATYTVTPVSGTCTGSPFTITATIDQIPSAITQTVTTCSGTGFTATPADGGSNVIPTGTTYSWSVPSVTGGMTGGAAGTNVSGITGTLTNSTNIVQTATYTVTPKSGTCTGTPFTVNVSVNPKASITAMAAPVCSGTTFTATPANITNGIVPAGTTYSWSAPTVTGGMTGGAAGTNASSITGTLINGTNAVQTATYTVTPLSGSCTGSPFTVTATINPTPSITTITASACSGSSFTSTPVNITNGIVPAGTMYTWAPPTVTGSITGGSSGSNAASITGTLNNPTATPQTATYTVTPVSGTCTGTPFTVTTTVNPLPVIVSALEDIQCLGSGTSVNASTSGVSTYQWQFSSDGGSTWSTVPNSGIYSGANTQTLNISTTDTGMLSYYFRVNGTGIAPCGSVQSAAVPLRFANQWLGSANTDWNTNTNWTNNQLPDFNACSWVIIPAGTTFLPKLDADKIVPGIVILKGSSLDLNGHNLTIGGTFLGTGKLSGSATSGLIINGAAGTISFTPNSPFNQLKTLTVNSGGNLTLGGNIASGDTLNIVAGDAVNGYGTVTANGILNTGSLLALKSDANGTATVAASSGVINDTVTVERYFPAVRAWRFVAVPFSITNQTINAAWQEGWVNSVLQCPSQYAGTPGYGTEISGGSSANGFDINNTGFTSLQVYRNNAWATPGSTYSNLLTASSNNAYSLFVRGDRNVCLTDVLPPDITTLRPRGILNQRSNGADITVNFSGAKPGDFILIGNPYAAPLDIEAAVKSRNSGLTSDQFWVWNPTLGGTNGVGGYVAFSGGLQVPQNGDTTNYAANTVIQSGEAFMVQVTNASGSITFRENDKASIEKTAGVFGLMATKNSHPHAPPALYVNLLDTNKAIADGVAVGFGNKFSTHIETVDAPKKWNEQIENMAIVKHDTALAIDFRPMPKNADSVQLRLYLRQQPYSLQVFTKGVRADLPAELWLIDKYLGTRTQLDIYNTNLYSFTPNRDTNSYRNRFMVVFNRIGKKQQQDKGIKTATNAIAGNDPGDGSIVTVYPNPINAGKAMLRFNNMPAGSYQMAVYNGLGERLSTNTIEHSGANSVYPLEIRSSWPSGIYNIHIVNVRISSAQNVTFVIKR